MYVQNKFNPTYTVFQTFMSINKHISMSYEHYLKIGQRKNTAQSTPISSVVQTSIDIIDGNNKLRRTSVPAGFYFAI